MQISLDINRTLGAVNPVWSFGFNTCHAPLWLRADLPAQCADVNAAVGFRYIRFHDTFSDRLGIYQEDETGKPVLDFQKFDTVFDKILAGGFLPFFEISFVPAALQDESGKLPRDYSRWEWLIQQLIAHILERYGLECAKKWYYEVWNEPDLYYHQDLETYLTLYDHTVLAIKSVCPALRVGGPATSRCQWIPEFVSHVVNGSAVSNGKPLPCDFITTHAYPTDQKHLDPVINGVKTSRSNLLSLIFHQARAVIDASPLKGTPFFMGEWNSSAGPMAWNHDEKNNGAFILKTINDLRDCIDGSMYWTLSDIYEELGLHYTPFHGGYGIVSVNDIPKSSYHAFAMLNRLSGQELQLTPDAVPESCGSLASWDEAAQTLTVILYHYQAPDVPQESAEPFLLQLCGLPTETVRLHTYAVNDRSGSAYEWWQKLGSPDYLNQRLLSLLLEKSHMEETSGLLFRNTDQTYTITGSIGSGDCMMIRICC